jgi:hypothetical protein
MTNSTTWQKDLSHTIFSITLSILLFLPVAMLISLFISWVFSLMDLYSWLVQQPQWLFWVIFGTLTMLGIGAIMLWADKQVESKVLSKFTDDKLALAGAVGFFIIVATLAYFIISWYMNFLNLNFWLT